ncbi:class I SAM-dependent methyltransferase [Streptomyces sp. SL13]|uniref:Class I SAM-dependent methyltransferase n=1 Tax=Streptantibioticus silvisoli TaxID=2705255 RepID=A0AA90H057_9ACTN|nr:class I SAM-dependent methyltransferase [Streptantibioticus silvisoli]MDI5962838.1 class I SAM-dependent methyltransferase [Streptantibioticus silvisoli]MDI5969666.1 class I SAM-dependent methyltransferase [Streptantibioticus silvisoli]
MTFSRAQYAASFNVVAAKYAATRPSYPPQLFVEIEELAGRPLSEADVLDVGAGTGIATRLLHDHGANVTAVEPSAGMATQLRAEIPHARLLRGTGDQLPFADATADFVTYAQAWHWTDPSRSVPEALRVLRPGGALAMWWNVDDPASVWMTEQKERLARRVPDQHRHVTPAEAGDRIRELGLGLEPVCRDDLRWTRETSVDHHLDTLASHSFLAVLDDAEVESILADEREALLEVFPDGVVVEAYAVLLTVLVKDDAPAPQK